MSGLRLYLLLFSFLLLSGCNSDTSPVIKVDANLSSADDSNDSDSTLQERAEYTDRMYVIKSGSSFDFGSSQTLVNREAVVTPMCYTKHDEQYNPCYVCHQDKIPDGHANKMDDGYLQNEYRFSDFGRNNHWSNLFKDRSGDVAKISDATIDAYVNTQNYTDLNKLLDDNDFTGYIPDLQDYHLGAEAFNSDGFAKDGSGWVAFNYKPLPSTFWPVNGSTDDVAIRLHKDFRKSAEGNLSVTVYKFNLAIVEAAIKDLKTITVDSLDERIINVDLNGDGNLSIVDRINRPEYYVGKASYMKVETFLYPRYTEFLHTVRYVGSKEEGEIYNAPRMKELRYMIKNSAYQDATYPMTKENLAILYDAEWEEKYQGNEPSYSSLGEKGLNNAMGWWVQGFIEDAEGHLRPQNYEETFFCMGCHTTIGSTIDQVFSFSRKVDGVEGWGYIDLRKMIDVPNVGESEGEILTYFKRVGGGNEFRVDNDVQTRFYVNGVLDENKVKSVSSIYELITPTRASALEMNKAYKVLVESQEFIHGRDGNVHAVQNVYSEITEATPTLPAEKKYDWDIRLDWSNALQKQ